MSEASASEKLYTLTEVAKRTNISMPTLQRYKKLYQDRIPSSGAGRTQRYPEDALDVFRQLKDENMGKRGRPRKNASPDARTVKRPKSSSRVRRAAAMAAAKKAERAGGSSDSLLTLKQIEGLTGISYPTLLRYVKTSLKRIPHKGTGRKRRYLPEAVGVFKTLREESRRGRKRAAAKPARKTARSAPAPKRTASRGRTAAVGGESAALLAELKEMRKAHRDLHRQVQKLERELHKPFKVVLKR